MQNFLWEAEATFIPANPCFLCEPKLTPSRIHGVDVNIEAVLFVKFAPYVRRSAARMEHKFQISVKSEANEDGIENGCTDMGKMRYVEMPAWA
jgi:hypothetical protein